MTVIDYLQNAAMRFPDKIAFADQDKGISFGELLERARHIAAALTDRFGTVNEPVAVVIDRNVESICAFMGIAMSRNFYVPIGSMQPLQRIDLILEQMQPKAIIAIGSSLPGLTNPDRIPILQYDELAEYETDGDRLCEVRKGCLDTDPLYAICTSGSTGVPKGVLISHRCVMDFIPVFCETFSMDEREVFGNQAPFDFDVSVKDIYSTLYCGASMYIMPRVCFSMPKLMVDALDERRVTTIVWAVSALCIAVGVNAFKHRVPGHLKKILFSGEVMPVKLLNVWRSYFPDAMFVNLYGPTEITCNCLYYILDRAFENNEKLPLGIPFQNEGVLFLNENDEPVKTGETGEICVTGTCLAIGYYRNPERTEAAFVQNPCNDRYPERMYRTGDLALLGKDGQYYFAGRKDFQIKHMGHRIELEEIETFLGAIGGVRRASCLFDEKRNKIVAFYEADLDKTEIIKAPSGRGITGMDIVLLGTSRLLYHCAETIRTFYRRDKAVTILDTDPSPINQKYKAEFPIVSGTKQELMDYLRSINADTVVLSVNNRYLIPADVIRLPQLVLINLHHALLPAHPGRNAEAWTIFEGDAVGGITWHYIDAGIDTGRILLQKATQITGQMRSIDLLKACEELAVCSLKELLPLEQALLLPSRVQQTQDRIVHRAGQIPGEGYLDRNWDIDQMSCFLRAMDYGAKFPLGRPLVSIGGERFWIRRYTIEKTENAVSSKHSDYNPEKREMTIREKDCRITLKLRKR